MSGNGLVVRQSLYRRTLVEEQLVFVVGLVEVSPGPYLTLAEAVQLSFLYQIVVPQCCGIEEASLDARQFISDHYRKHMSFLLLFALEFSQWSLEDHSSSYFETAVELREVVYLMKVLVVSLIGRGNFLELQLTLSPLGTSRT